MRPITLAAGLVLALAAEGLAQPAACIVAANDGLAAARRARSAVADQAAYQRAVDLRRAALVATDAAHGIQDPWMLQTHLLIATTAVQGYELCGEQADLAGDLTAVGAEWRTTDGEWGAGISLVSGGDSRLRPTSGHRGPAREPGRGGPRVRVLARRRCRPRRGRRWATARFTTPRYDLTGE
ncbi:MAG: hypothetical protein R3F43_32705 [bacterium]